MPTTMTTTTPDAIVQPLGRQIANEYLLVFIVEQNLVGISNVMLVIFYHRLGYTRRVIGPLCENKYHKTGSM